MKQIIKFFAIALILSATYISVMAQPGASATATATATIITPIAINKDVDMNFGNLSVSAVTAGTLQLATDGTRTPAGGVSLPTGAGTVTAAQFTVTGLAGLDYTISLPASVTITDGTNNMTVDNFVSNPTPTGTLTGGTSTLLVGATLNVSAGQPAGIYTTTTPFTVTVDYQ